MKHHFSCNQKLFFLKSTDYIVLPCQLSGMMFLLHTKGPRIKPPLSKSFFFFYFMGSQVQILAKMPIFQLPPTKMPHPSGGLYGHPEQPQGGGELRKAAEIGLKCKKKSKNALLLNRKKQKTHFFKNPSFKFKKLLVC